MSHAEHHHNHQVEKTGDMPGSQMSEPKPADEECKAVFNDEEVKHGVLHKLWVLHKDDERHHLHEVNKLKHLEHYAPLIYATEAEPFGTNYFAKILLDDEGHCIHVRAFKSSEGELKFHAIHWRPDEEGGAVFTKEDPLKYFDY